MGGGGVRVLRATGRQNICNKLSGRHFYLIVLCVFFFFSQNTIDVTYQRLWSWWMNSVHVVLQRSVSV